jgi:hypothetical protein
MLPPSSGWIWYWFFVHHLTLYKNWENATFRELYLLPSSCNNVVYSTLFIDCKTMNKFQRNSNVNYNLSLSEPFKINFSHVVSFPLFLTSDVIRLLQRNLWSLKVTINSEVRNITINTRDRPSATLKAHQNKQTNKHFVDTRSPVNICLLSLQIHMIPTCPNWEISSCSGETLPSTSTSRYAVMACSIQNLTYEIYESILDIW